MNKLLILLAIVIVILALWSFDDSFIHSSAKGSAIGTSAVIFAKTDSVSVRARFTVIPQAGTKANITFPNGSEIQDITTYQFEVLMPKNSSANRSFYTTAPGNIILSSKNPCSATVVSNVTDTFFSTIQPSSDGITVYSFKVQGNARVTVAWFGVGI